MAGLIEDLLAGLPQAYNTLEELLAQSKLGRQHYGPRDSMIASAIAHPIEGAQKTGQWLQDQMMAASQAPMQPMTDPRGAEAAISAGLNLAGLMQTGGLPVAPNEPGVLGTIRGSKIKEVLDELEAKGFDAKNPWYHGSTHVIPNKEWRPPTFFTKNREDADFFAKENAAGSDPDLYPLGAMNKVFLKKDKLLDMRKDYFDTHSKLVKHLEKAGLKNEAGDDFDHYYPQVSEYSPYEGTNINDTTYHPDFQQYLKDHGHNGLRNWDMLGRGEIDTAIMVDPEGIYNIVTKKPTMAQYRKNKIPAKVVKLINKYKDK